MNARPRIAFLTGQSDPRGCALSPAQRAFLDALPLDGIEAAEHNFPWDAASAPWRPTSLPRASLANGRQYFAARRGRLCLPAPAVEAARAWLQAAPRTLLLTGSCGLALLDALLAPWPTDASLRTRLRVLAYGAVSPRWPHGVAGRQLRGRRDWIAALGAPRAAPAPEWIDSGHLDYLRAPPLHAAACALLPWLHGEIA